MQCMVMSADVLCYIILHCMVMFCIVCGNALWLLKDRVV